jgi:transcriptional regulator with XRE-family HTH domain
MNEGKVDIVKLNRMLRAGKSVSECAKFFGVTPSAISQAKKNLNVSVVKNVALENAHRVMDQNLDAVEQLHKINKVANRLLDELEQTPELRLKVMAEIRNQLRLQLEIFQALYDMKAVQEFQAEVLDIIGKADKGVRDEIIHRLNEKRAIRSAVRFD